MAQDTPPGSHPRGPPLAGAGGCHLAGHGLRHAPGGSGSPTPGTRAPAPGGPRRHLNLPAPSARDPHRTPPSLSPHPGRLDPPHSAARHTGPAAPTGPYCPHIAGDSRSRHALAQPHAGQAHRSRCHYRFPPRKYPCQATPTGRDLRYRLEFTAANTRVEVLDELVEEAKADFRQGYTEPYSYTVFNLAIRLLKSGLKFRTKKVLTSIRKGSIEMTCCAIIRC